MKIYYITSTEYSIQERRTKKKGIVYDVFFRVITMDGVLRQKKLSGFKSKTLAKEAHSRFITEECELVTSVPTLSNTAQTQNDGLVVRDLIAIYLVSLRNQNKESSIYDKKHIYSLFVLPQLGEYRLRDLTVEVLKKWQADLWATVNPKTGEFYSFKYLSKTRGHLGAFLSWAEETYGLRNNLKTIKRPRKRKSAFEMTDPEEQIWRREEFDKFIQCVDNPMWRALFATLFFTGRRKGEVLALKINNVKKDHIFFGSTVTRKTLDETTYKITSTKNEKAEATYICEPLQKELQAYTPQSPYYFGGKRPLAENTVARRLDYYIEKAGVKRITPKGMRHSFVTMVIHMGASDRTVAKLIGDTVEQIQKTYGHLYNDDTTKIVTKIE